MAMLSYHTVYIIWNILISIMKNLKPMPVHFFKIMEGKERNLEDISSLPNFEFQFWNTNKYALRQQELVSVFACDIHASL